MKTFLKTFFVGLLIFTVLLVPMQWGLSFASGIRVFAGEENLAEDVPNLVQADDEFAQAFGDAKRVNVLLIGINDGMSDTLMLGSYDLKRQHVTVISIPRDTYYERSDADSAAERKINSIYSVHKASGTATAISDVLQGMPINYYVVVDYKVVEKVVDAMGGVPMNITFHMHYNDPYDTPPLKIDIPEGYQILDGETAVEFLRFRKGSDGYAGYPQGDLGRIKAQQEFVKSAFRQALGFSLPKVVKTVLTNVDSDLSLGMAAKLAAAATKLDGESIETVMIPGEAGTKDGLSYFFADEEAVGDMLDTIYHPVEKEETTDESGDASQ